jgi:hypothetical protein
MVQDGCRRHNCCHCFYGGIGRAEWRAAVELPFHNNAPCLNAAGAVPFCAMPLLRDTPYNTVPLLP